MVGLLAGGDSAAQAAAALAEEFDVDPAQALLDVTALMDQLRAARLVVTP